VPSHTTGTRPWPPVTCRHHRTLPACLLGPAPARTARMLNPIPRPPTTHLTGGQIRGPTNPWGQHPGDRASHPVSPQDRHAHMTRSARHMAAVSATRKPAISAATRARCHDDLITQRNRYRPDGRHREGPSLRLGRSHPQGGPAYQARRSDIPHRGRSGRSLPLLPCIPQPVAQSPRGGPDRGWWNATRVRGRGFGRSIGSWRPGTGPWAVIPGRGAGAASVDCGRCRRAAIRFRTRPGRGGTSRSVSGRS
jgi:hypothetical protein